MNNVRFTPNSRPALCQKRTLRFAASPPSSQFTPSATRLRVPVEEPSTIIAIVAQGQGLMIIGRLVTLFRNSPGGDYGDRMAHQSGAFSQLQLCLWLPLQIHCLADSWQLPLGRRLRDRGGVFWCDPP